MHYYKVIIADDEVMNRRGLLENIDWDKLGFRVVADVMDGQDVIDYAQENEVDVIFTDVLMCKVSGLEVARWARTHRPQIKVVIISGYREFSYVKEAMELKCCDYVLKPINPVEVETTFLKVREELDQRQTGKVSEINMLFSYQEDEACINTLAAEQVLLETVVGGNSVRLDENWQDWKCAVCKVRSEYVPLLVMHIIEKIFQRLSKDGISLENDYDKNAILRKIRSLQGAHLIERTGDILEEITLQVEKKKSTASLDVVNRAKQYISMHLAEDIGVEQIAAHVYVNRSYLYKEFVNHVGISVMDYIIQRRMEKAIELIRQKYTTKEIAQMVGYADVKYFQRCFKKYTNCTVKEYRNLLR